MGIMAWIVSRPGFRHDRKEAGQAQGGRPA